MKTSVVLPILLTEPWQIPMTQCSIDTLRCTTAEEFELVIVETGSRHFQHKADKYIHIPEKGRQTWDVNKGIDAAEGEFIVYTGNDVFTRPDWLAGLHECFEKYPDCGVATLMASELRVPSTGRIVEGVYGPFMMFKKPWRFDDECFPEEFADTDLVMRMYESGFRAYRNHAVTIHHLNRQSTVHDSDRYEAAKQRWEVRHGRGGAHLLMFHMLQKGWVV